MAKVLYFNIDDNLDYENALLKEWGIDDLELIEIKDKEYKKTFGEYVRDTGAEGLVVEYEQVTKEVMDMAPELKIVSLQSVWTLTQLPSIIFVLQIFQDFVQMKWRCIQSDLPLILQEKLPFLTAQYRVENGIHC